MQIEIENELAPWFVEVLLPILGHESFTYRLPRGAEEVVQVGMRVSVPFGRKKIYAGIVAQKHRNIPQGYAAKYILEVLDETPLVSEATIAFWQWVAEYYCTNVGKVMDAALPSYMKLQGDTVVSWTGEIYPNLELLGQVENLLLENLEVANAQKVGDLQQKIKVGNVMRGLKNLFELGLIDFEEVVEERYKATMESFVRIGATVGENKKEIYKDLEKSPKQLKVWMALEAMGRNEEMVGKKALLEKAGSNDAALKALVGKGIVEVYKAEKSIYNTPSKQEQGAMQELTANQAEAIEAINKGWETHKTILLWGDTGSGKTMVYSQLCKEAIAAGQQCLWVVPEAVLSTQHFQWMQKTMGVRIGIYHQKLSAKEQYELWQGVRLQAYDLIIGVKSAVFLPFVSLGLIIVDEEQDSQHKQSHSAPRFHARDVALKLGFDMGIKVLLGSAIPSLESYHQVKIGRYGMVRLEGRLGAGAMPRIELVDKKLERSKMLGNSIVGPAMLHSLMENKAKGKLSLVFQNRRGFAPRVECGRCNWSGQCKNCDIHLTYHQSRHRLECHYCGFGVGYPQSCPSCGGKTLNTKGFGTEKLEEEIKSQMPDAIVERFDGDKLSSRNKIVKLLQRIDGGQVDVIVGTQIAIKGMHFERLQLACVPDVDQLLRFPDFRASEKAYQTLMQIAGRCGRSEAGSVMLLQTGTVDHAMLRELKEGNVELYEKWLVERRQFGYPPYTRLIKLVMEHEKEDVLAAGAKALIGYLRQGMQHQILGPEVPYVGRLRGKHQMQSMIKLPKNAQAGIEAKMLIKEGLTWLKTNKAWKNIQIMVVVDPE